MSSSTTLTSESPSTTPTAASWTFCRAKVHNHVHDIAGGRGVGRKSQAFWRARPALAMIIVITCDKVIEKLHLRKMIRRMWGRRRKAGEKIVQRTCRSLLVFRGSRGGLLRRLGHFGMRQHRALRREYGFLACREEAPSSGFAAEEALASAPRAFVSRLDALPGIAGNGFALLPSVIAFGTWLVPALFCLSSLSCGVAVAFGTASFVDSRVPFNAALRCLSRVDRAIIVAEMVALALFVASLLTDARTEAGGRALLAADEAIMFWVVLVLAGLVAPFILEIRYLGGDRRTKGLWIAFYVLLGGAALRVCVTGLAAFDISQSPELTIQMAFAAAGG